MNPGREDQENNDHLSQTRLGPGGLIRVGDNITLAVAIDM